MCTAASTLQAVRKLMRDHGKEDASPKEEFMALLASGALSPAMHQFLTSTLGMSGSCMHQAPGRHHASMALAPVSAHP